MDKEELRRSKRNKFHLNVAAIMAPHTEKRHRSVTPPAPPTVKSEQKEKMKPPTTHVSKRTRKVPVRHLDFVSDEHLEPELDDEAPVLSPIKPEYFCVHCPAHFPSRTGLANHSKQHGSQKKFHCDQCDMSCATYKTLRIHNLVHLEGKPLTPEKCTYDQQTQDEDKEEESAGDEDGTSDEMVVMKIEESQVVEPNREGSVSPPRTASQQGRSKSASSASKLNSFPCQQCPFATRDATRLATHEEGHFRPRGFQCPMCSFRSESAGFLKRHCDIHGEEKYKWPPVYIGRNPNKRKIVARMPRVRKEKNKPSASVSRGRDSESCASVPLKKKKPTPQRRIKIKRTKSGPVPIIEEKTEEQKTVSVESREYHKAIPRFTRGRVSVTRGNIKCLHCSRRFKQHYERSAHQKICPRAPKRSKTVYAALFNERMPHVINSQIQLNEPMEEPKEETEQRAHKCADCPFTCSMKSKMHRHENKHLVKAEFPCLICTFSCRAPETLAQHTRLHRSSRKKPVAQVPDKVVAEPSTDQSATKPPGKMEKCPDCPYRSRHNCDMKAHAIMHVGTRQFGCKECTYSTKRHHVLEAHAQMHAAEVDGVPVQQSAPKLHKRSLRYKSKLIGTRSGSGLSTVYTCQNCPYTTKFCSSLSMHARDHTSRGDLQCGRCTFSSSFPSKLKEHTKLHPMTKTPQPSRAPHSTEQYKCRECPFMCASYNQLWHHYQKHKKVSKYSCDQCSFSTGAQHCLFEHRALHAASKHTPVQQYVLMPQIRVESPPEREQPVALTVEEEEAQQQPPELAEESLIVTEQHKVIQEETENTIRVAPIEADSKAEQPTVIDVPCPVKKRDMDLRCSRCPTLVHSYNDFIEHYETMHRYKIENKATNNTTAPGKKPAEDKDKRCMNDQRPGLILPHDLDLNAPENVETVVIDIISPTGTEVLTFVI